MTAIKFYDVTIPLFNRLRAPLNAGTLDTFAGGTVTPLATYKDEALTMPNATTLTTDANGYLPFDVWVSDAVAYRFVCITSASVPVFFEDQILQVSFFVNTSGSITQLSGNPVLISSGTGSPEGAVTANVSSMYLRIDGSASSVLYMKQTGTGNTGWVAISTAASTVTSVSGTSNRITSTGGTTPVIDISASYVGQSSITTLGTVATGVWNGTTIAVANGGTGITSFGTGVATWLGTPSSSNLAAAVTDETGTGALVFGTSPTFTTNITTPTAVFTGSANTSKNFTANSGASITINATDGAYQTITLTANTTITLGSVPAGTTEQEFILELVQDGTGGRTVAWSNITFANNGGALPPINSAISGSTYIGISGTSTRWVGYPVNQGLGISNGSIPASGYVGYSTSSSIAIGSAVSLTTGTAANVTQITIGPGSFRLTGNIGFIPAAGTLPTILVGSINTTTATQATSPNGGAFVRQAVAFPATESQVMPVGSMIVNPTVSTTYYLVATATFSVSTLTAYGSITAVEYI